jgi:hypothetical protein
LLKDKLAEVLRRQNEFLSGNLHKGVVFGSHEELEKRIVRPTNKIAIELGFAPNLYIKDFRGSNSTKQKYLSVGCSGCPHSNTLIWFTFEGGRDSEERPYDIKYCRFPYGMEPHT